MSLKTALLATSTWFFCCAVMAQPVSPTGSTSVAPFGAPNGTNDTQSFNSACAGGGVVIVPGTTSTSQYNLPTAPSCPVSTSWQIGPGARFTGAGASAFLANTKYTQPVSIVSLGADATGVADSSSAFTSAFALTNNPVITLPPGTFLIACGHTFNAASNVSFVGSGRDITTIKFAAGCTNPGGATSPTDLFHWDGKSGVRISDLTIDLNTPVATTNAYSVLGFYAYAQSADALSVNQISIINAVSETFLLSVSATSGHSYSNVQVKNNYLQMSPATTQNQCVQMSTINGTGYIPSPIIENNTCVGSGLGIDGAYAKVVGNDISGFLFGNAIFTNPTNSITPTGASWAAGIATLTFASTSNAFSVGEPITVQGVTPNGYNTAMATVTGTTNTSVSYALASNPGSGSAYGLVAPYPTCHDALIANNIMHDTTAGVDVNNSTHNGLENQCYGSLVIGNKAYRLGGSGFSNFASYVTYSGNLAYDNGKNGIAGLNAMLDIEGFNLSIGQTNYYFRSQNVTFLGNTAFDDGPGTQIYGLLEEPYNTFSTTLLSNNFTGVPIAATVTGASWASNTATLTFASNALPIQVGQVIKVTNVFPTGYNGTYFVTAQTSTSVSYSVGSNPGSYSSGGNISAGQGVVMNTGGGGAPGGTSTVNQFSSSSATFGPSPQPANSVYRVTALNDIYHDNVLDIWNTSINPVGSICGNSAHRFLDSQGYEHAAVGLSPDVASQDATSPCANAFYGGNNFYIELSLNGNSFVSGSRINTPMPNFDIDFTHNGYDSGSIQTNFHALDINGETNAWTIYSSNTTSNSTSFSPYWPFIQILPESTKQTFFGSDLIQRFDIRMATISSPVNLIAYSSNGTGTALRLDDTGGAGVDLASFGQYGLVVKNASSSVVDWTLASGGVAGNPATVTYGADGSDSNINVKLQPKGNGGTILGGFTRLNTTLYANLSTVDPSPAVGDQLVITDASACTANTAVSAGGGTTHSCPVIYNGANWIPPVTH